MKKKLFLLLRILVAVAGLAYIGSKLDWHDKVELPRGFQAASGRVMTKAESAPIVSGDFDPVNPRSELTVLIDGIRQAIAPGQIGAGEGRVLLRPGLLTTLRHAKIPYLLLGLILIAPIYPIQAMRWRMLMRCRGMDVTLGRSFKLVMVGSFFNYAMPGSTGGDVVKAYYAAARSERRADAVISVLIDRIVGLLGLVLLAGFSGLAVRLYSHQVAGSPGLEQCFGRTNHVTIWLWLVMAGVLVLSALYFSRRLRNKLGLEWLLAKILPPGSIADKLDKAMVAYSNQKGTVTATVAMSVPLQFCLAASTALAGFSLGLDARWAVFVLLLAVVPFLFLVAAIPISYQGFGFMEGAGFALLLAPGVANANQIVVMLLLARVFQVLYSLTGSVFLLGGDIHMHPETSEPAARPVQPTSPSPTA